MLYHFHVTVLQLFSVRLDFRLSATTVPADLTLSPSPSSIYLSHYLQSPLQSLSLSNHHLPPTSTYILPIFTLSTPLLNRSPLDSTTRFNAVSISAVALVFHGHQCAVQVFVDAPSLRLAGPIGHLVERNALPDWKVGLMAKIIMTQLQNQKLGFSCVMIEPIDRMPSATLCDMWSAAPQ